MFRQESDKPASINALPWTESTPNEMIQIMKEEKGDGASADRQLTGKPNIKKALTNFVNSG